jgi:hypothetical protein
MCATTTSIIGDFGSLGLRWLSRYIGIEVTDFREKTHSVTQSLSHSVTQSLSHSVTQSLSHSVTQSLPLLQRFDILL